MNKEQLIEKYRDINFYDNWYDSIYESFRDDMLLHGIKVDEIYFSGFWSQGDGACFEGSVYDWDLFLQSIGYTSKALIQLASDNWATSVKHRGYYYHENCTSFDHEWHLPKPDGNLDDELFIDYFSRYLPDDVRGMVWLSMLKTVDYDKLMEAVEDAFRDHMRTLYRTLEAEYEYLTSDEAVWEAIVANELDTQPQEEV
jgi:hypothetical protein